MMPGGPTGPAERWAPGYLAWPVAVLAGYGVLRAALVAWNLTHAVPLADAHVVIGAAAAVQGFAAAAILAVPALRRPLLIWIAVVVTLAVTVVGTAIWVVHDDGPAGLPALQVVFATSFAVLILLIGGWQPRWAYHGGQVDLARIRRVLLATVAAATTVAAVGGLMIAAGHAAGARHPSGGARRRHRRRVRPYGPARRRVRPR